MSRVALCVVLAFAAVFLAVTARQTSARVTEPPTLRLPGDLLLGFDFRLSPSGFGPIHFGMDAQQASRAIGSLVSVEGGPNGCAFWTVPGLPESGVQLIALQGRLAYGLLYQRGLATTRRIKVGDGLNRLRHRYRGRLRSGRSASLSGAELRLFSDSHRGGATYTIEFDISNGKVAFISAGTRHVIETFGECS